MNDLITVLDSDTLRAFVVQQRWFRGKARHVVSVQIADWVSVVAGTVIVVVDVEFSDGAPESYFLPLVIGEELSDGLLHDGLCRSLLALATNGGQVRTARGVLRGDATLGGAQLDALDTDIRRSAADQSNTSVVFGSTLMVKVFRRVEPGINPDVELSTFLTRRQFAHAPATVGAIEYLRDDHPMPASAVMVQRFIPNLGNGWETTLRHLARYFGNDAADPREYTDLAEVLGQRTGEMHGTLAAGTEPVIAPELYTDAELEAEVRRMRADLDRLLRLLDRTCGRLAPDVAADAAKLPGCCNAIARVFDSLRGLAGTAWRIRCHGDYHLGQILVTDDDVMILDFEGEPARPIAERRAKASPLRDVSGMLRSFSYAAAATGRERPEQAARWEQLAGSRFLRAYRQATADAQVVPSDTAAFDTLLRAYTMDKAIYELGYELNNRPDWVAIPLNGILRLADAHGSEP